MFISRLWVTEKSTPWRWVTPPARPLPPGVTSPAGTAAKRHRTPPRCGKTVSARRPG